MFAVQVCFCLILSLFGKILYVYWCSFKHKGTGLPWQEHNASYWQYPPTTTYIQQEAAISRYIQRVNKPTTTSTPLQLCLFVCNYVLITLNYWLVILLLLDLGMHRSNITGGLVNPYSGTGVGSGGEKKQIDASLIVWYYNVIQFTSVQVKFKHVECVCPHTVVFVTFTSSILNSSASN